MDPPLVSSVRLSPARNFDILSDILEEGILAADESGRCLCFTKITRSRHTALTLVPEVTMIENENSTSTTLSSNTKGEVSSTYKLEWSM